MNYSRRRSVEFLNSWLDFQAQRHCVPGFVITVVDGGDPIFSRAFGHADMENDTPLTTEHLFNIGSQAKMVTATAILQLAERGLIDLEQSVAHYQPWLLTHNDHRFGLITVRELLWHGSGMIRDGLHADYWQLEAPFPDVDALRELVLEANLALDNGTQLKYSNLGYALLGQLVETVCDMPYAQYVQKNIIELLESPTMTVYSKAIEPQLTTTYTRPVEGRRTALPKSAPTHAFTSVAGWYATTADLSGFMQELLSTSTRLLNLSSKRELRESRRSHWTPSHRRGTPYGHGSEIQRFGRRELFGHSGGFIGYRSCSYGEIDDGLIVMVMANAIDAPIIQMTRGVFGVFDHFEDNATSETSVERAAFNTRLETPWETLEIVATSDRIVSISPESWIPFSNIQEELVMESPTVLRITTGSDLHYKGETITFTRDGLGRVELVNYAGSSTKATAVRL